MRHVRPIVAGLVLLLACLCASPAGQSSQRLIIEQPEGLFEQTSTVRAFVHLADAAHYAKVIGPDGVIYIIVGDDSGASTLTLIECDRVGEVKSTRVISGPRVSPITAINAATFLPDGRLFVDCHINPWQSLAVTIDLAMGDKAIFVGNRFTPDPAGKRIAYCVDRCASASAPATTELWLDGNKLRDLPPCDDADLSWSTTGETLTVSLSCSGKPTAPLVMQIPTAVLAASD